MFRNERSLAICEASTLIWRNLCRRHVLYILSAQHIDVSQIPRQASQRRLRELYDFFLVHFCLYLFLKCKVSNFLTITQIYPRLHFVDGLLFRSHGNALINSGFSAIVVSYGHAVDVYATSHPHAAAVLQIPGHGRGLIHIATTG